MRTEAADSERMRGGFSHSVQAGFSVRILAQVEEGTTEKSVSCREILQNDLKFRYPSNSRF